MGDIAVSKCSASAAVFLYTECNLTGICRFCDAHPHASITANPILQIIHTLYQRLLILNIFHPVTPVSRDYTPHSISYIRNKQPHNAASLLANANVKPTSVSQSVRYHDLSLNTAFPVSCVRIHGFPYCPPFVLAGSQKRVTPPS